MAAPQSGRAGKIWTKIASGLGVLLLLCALGAVRAGFGGWFDGDDDKKAYPKASHPSGIAATSTAKAQVGGTFAGTPAADYPEGAAGITLPAAAASGVFTAKQVSDALTSVKKALIAGRLDNAMLVNRNPTPFLNLLAPDAKPGMRKDFSSADFSVYATQFSPLAKPAKIAPRVKGRISYQVTTDEDGFPVIEINTNFVWVYAFDRPASSPGDNLVVVHDELVWQVPQASKVAKSSRGLWLSDGQSYASNMDCSQFDKGLIAPGVQKLVTGKGDDEDPDSMFDPDRALDVGNNC